MPDETELPSESPRLTHVPRLSIVHLLLLTSLAGVVLGLTVSPGLGRNPLLNFNMISPRLLNAVALSGMVLIVWYLLLRTLWPLEPGEWLVIAAGLSALLNVMSNSPLAERTRPFFTIVSIPVLQGLVYGAVALPLLVRNRWWGAVAAATATVIASHNFLAQMIPEFFFRYLPLIKSLPIVALVTTAILTDHRHQQRRHWLHYLGILLIAGWLICDATSWYWWRFVFDWNANWG